MCRTPRTTVHLFIQIAVYIYMLCVASRKVNIIISLEFVMRLKCHSCMVSIFSIVYNAETSFMVLE